MSKLLMPQLAASIGDLAGWHGPAPQEESPSLAIRCMHTLQLWIGRRRQRRALAAMDRHLLQDIGVSQAAALCEAAKPFWRQ
jgi:uncharacterized protein YjiS (DUF1127 family)